MGRYVMRLDRDGLMGEGASCVCRRGFDLKTDRQVAIKTYKADPSASHRFDDACRRFRRQIDVLRELTAPLRPPSDQTLWCERLAQADPKDLFMELIDCSRDKSGRPGPDPTDGLLYVITELAECSLKDYIKERREGGSKMSRDTVRNITNAIVLVAAGLHAHGYAHLDIKPDNLMFFGRKLKLIDVDGCLRIGSTASVWDGTLSFSPIYCAPEWAGFLQSRSTDFAVAPQLDVWSVGMTLCELVTYRPVLSATFAEFYCQTRALSYKVAMEHFMKWLRRIPGPPIPQEIEEFDPKLYRLLKDNLLLVDPSARKSLADSLSHPYVRAARLSSKGSCPLAHDADIPMDFHLQLHRHPPEGGQVGSASEH